jgi:hypothetical protein
VGILGRLPTRFAATLVALLATGLAASPFGLPFLGGLSRAGETALALTSKREFLVSAVFHRAAPMPWDDHSAAALVRVRSKNLGRNRNTELAQAVVNRLRTSPEMRQLLGPTGILTAPTIVVASGHTPSTPVSAQTIDRAPAATTELDLPRDGARAALDVSLVTASAPGSANPVVETTVPAPTTSTTRPAAPPVVTLVPAAERTTPGTSASVPFKVSDNTTISVGASRPPVVKPTTTTTSTTTTSTTTEPVAKSSPVPSRAFAMGISSGYPYGWVTQADINTMVDLGVSWARYDINQSQTLAASDAFVYPTLAAGIHVLGILMPDSTDSTRSAAWARTVVEHYAPKGVHVWEWRNESNWARTDVPVATYTAELKAAYTAIHQVDPSATVLTGGSVPAGATPTAAYLQAIYDDGGQGFFDGVADHPYDGGQSIVTTWPEIDDMTTIHNVMVAHGDGAKRVWATEVGFTTVTGASSGMTEANAATMLVNLVTRLKALAAAGVAQPIMCYYSLRDRPQSSVRESHFGIIRVDLSHKPAYATYQMLAEAG